MKTLKNVLMTLSVFIVAIFVLSLLGQKPPKLEDRVVALETKITTLETKVSTLEAWKTNKDQLLGPVFDHVNALETEWVQENVLWVDNIRPKLQPLVNNGLGPPAYDSGWLDVWIQKTRTLQHNLGGNTDTYVVDLQFKDTSNRPNQMFFGG